MGFDDGAVMIKIGREEPVASMDSSGKIIWARHNEIQTVNVKSLGSDYDEARTLHLLTLSGCAFEAVYGTLRTTVSLSACLPFFHDFADCLFCSGIEPSARSITEIRTTPRRVFTAAAAQPFRDLLTASS